MEPPECFALGFTDMGQRCANTIRADVLSGSIKIALKDKIHCWHLEFLGHRLRYHSSTRTS